jgi:hypothetical protein
LFGLRSGTDGQDAVLHFLSENVKAEQRLGIAFAPALCDPLDAHELQVGMMGQIEEQLIGPTLELLGETDERFGAPVLSIG